ncbi:unnamed protein product [Prunus brigantina]
MCFSFPFTSHMILSISLIFISFSLCPMALASVCPNPMVSPSRPVPPSHHLSASTSFQCSSAAP